MHSHAHTTSDTLPDEESVSTGTSTSAEEGR